MEFLRKAENIKLLVLGLLALFVLGIWYAIVRNERAALTVAFLDVGQGDAIFIESPNGNQILIDAGATSAVLRELGRVMPFYDRSVDLVVATHPDQDHIGGIPDVLSRYRSKILMRSGAVNDTGAFRELNRLVETGRVEEVIARRGMVIDFGDGVYAEVLFPDRDMSGVEPNAASIIMRLVYDDHEFLLTGDAPSSIEHYVAGLDGGHLASDVLKVGHHGSKTSSSEFFVGTVGPRYAIISAGRNNRYGHPHQEVLERLEQFDVEILSTAEEGAIVFESDGNLLTRR